MIRISGKQAHVLEHLNRVRPLAYVLAVRAPQRRYQLDGWECTAQITGLVVKGLVRELPQTLERRHGRFVVSTPPRSAAPAH